MLDALTRKYGPLPGWAWGLLIAGAAYWYMSRKKKQAAAAAAAQQNANNVSSNLQSVPVSNLTTAAQPMPIQLGDTFVNTGRGGGVSTTSGSPATTVIGSTTSANTMAPGTPPAASPATQTQTIC